MGLAEPRVKQRISADPRNLTWSNDQTKFGYKMLSKMGWSPGKGLGINEDGKTENTKLSIKKDNLGVGAATTNNSINNWLDNSNSFDKLLKGLNDKLQTEEKEEDKKEKKGSEQDIDDKAKIVKVKSKKKKKNKKEINDKNEKSTITSQSHSTTSELSINNNNSLIANTSDSESLSSIRLAHRAKFLKSKKAAIQDSDRLNEILGIKSNRNSSDNSDNTSTDAINTSIMTTSSSNNDESDMKDSRENIRKVDTINNVNEMSINEYFAQRMKGLRIPGTANKVNYDKNNDDTDERPSFSMGEGLNFMNNKQDASISNTSLKSSRSISNRNLKLTRNKKRKIDYDVDIDLS